MPPSQRCWTCHNRAINFMLVETGFEPDADSSPDIFRRRIEAEIAQWTPVVQKLGIKID